MNLLCHWGEQFERLDVYCDHSKPLQAGPGIMEAMIGREERVYIHFGGRQSALTFNLLKLPEFVDSKFHPGIQLADIVSGAASFGMMHPHAEGRELLAAVLPHLTSENVFPDLKYADLNRKGPFLNACLLIELSNRARARLDPLLHIVHHYVVLDMAYDMDPPPFAKRHRRQIASRK